MVSAETFIWARLPVDAFSNTTQTNNHLSGSLISLRSLPPKLIPRLSQDVAVKRHRRELRLLPITTVKPFGKRAASPLGQYEILVLGDHDRLIIARARAFVLDDNQLEICADGART